MGVSSYSHDERGFVGNLTHIPVVERSFGNLEVLAVDALCQLLEQRHHDSLELYWVYHIEYLFDLVEVHDLLWAIDLRPEPQKAKHHVFRQCGIFFQELDHAVCQLRMIKRQAFDFVQRQQNASEENLVLLLQREREAINDAAEDLQQLGNAVVPLGIVYELEEDVIDGPPDEGAKIQEFPVDPMQCCL